MRSRFAVSGSIGRRKSRAWLDQANGGGGKIGKVLKTFAAILPLLRYFYRYGLAQEVSYVPNRKPKDRN
jgi:hypothetical protein